MDSGGNQATTLQRRVPFEHFIGSYIVCLANLAHDSGGGGGGDADGGAPGSSSAGDPSGGGDPAAAAPMSSSSSANSSRTYLLNSNLFQLCLGFWKHMQLKYAHAHPNVMALNSNAAHRQFAQQQQQQQQFSDHHSYADNELTSVSTSTLLGGGVVAAPAAGTNANNAAPWPATTTTWQQQQQQQRRASMPPLLSEKHRLLMKRLELAFIEFFGKVMWRNGELKRAYAYTYDDAHYARLTEILVDQDTEWPALTNTFIKITLNFLNVSLEPAPSSTTTTTATVPVAIVAAASDGGEATARTASTTTTTKTTTTAVAAAGSGAGGSDDTRDFQLEALRFVALLLDDDIEMQARVVNASSASTSAVLHCFSMLMRTSSPFEVQKSALRSLWVLTGGDNWQETYDRKFALYTTIGVHKFLDVLYELGEVDANHEMFLYCLEALQIIGE